MPAISITSPAVPTSSLHNRTCRPEVRYAGERCSLKRYPQPAFLGFSRMQWPGFLPRPPSGTAITQPLERSNGIRSDGARHIEPPLRRRSRQTPPCSYQVLAARDGRRATSSVDRRRRSVPPPHPLQPECRQAAIPFYPHCNDIHGRNRHRTKPLQPWLPPASPSRSNGRTQPHQSIRSPVIRDPQEPLRSAAP